MAYFKDSQGSLHYLSDSDIANGGESLLPAGCVAVSDAQADAIQNPPMTLAQAQTEQIATLTLACQSEIVAGFTSNALGSTNNYPSLLQDQTNQNTVAQSLSGGSLWCETGGTWAMKAHTQGQAQMVVASFAVWLNACQQQLVALTALVNAATTPDAVQVIGWSTPTQS